MARSTAELFDQRAKKDVNDAEVDRLMSITYMDQLRVISALLVFFYVSLTLFHLYFTPEPTNITLATLSASITIIALGTYFLIKTGKLRPQISHYVLIPIAILTTVMTFLNVFINQDLDILNRALFIFVLAALFSVHAGVFWSVSIFVGILYGLALYGVDGAVAHHAFVGVVIFLGAMGLFYSRVTAMRQQVRLSLLNAAYERTMQDDVVTTDRFLGTMSYELRTPLTGVMGMMDLLKTTDLDITQKKYVDVAGQSAELLQHIINDILDMARLKSGELQLVNQVFRPTQVADNVLRILNAEAAQKGISVSFAEEGDIPDAVQGDLSRLSQVLMNLVSNAINQTKQGGVDVTLVGTRGEGVVRLKWSVKDMGKGLLAHEAENIFNRYEKMGELATKDSDGSGLGLAIAKSLVGLMGGEIGVDSEVGKGSTYWYEVSLPLAESTELIDDGVTLDLPLFDMSLTVLLAEDNPINQMLVLKLLAKGKSWRVLKATNGEEAVNFVKSHKPDLVLMDIQMPVMDGVEATKRIRALGEETSNLPIIALTANALDEDEIAYRDAGMTDFVAKPINAELFYAAIARGASRKKD